MCADGSDGETPCMIMNVEAPFYDDPVPPTKNNPSYSTTQEKGVFMGLWDYEVVEAFFLCSKSGHYLEVEVGPHGQHLVLLLNGRKNIIKECLPLQWDVTIGSVVLSNLITSYMF